MIITSSQQFENLSNPYDAIDMEEFESITLKFGSFVCISKNKKMNYLNFLKFLVDDKKTQKIYFALLSEYSLQNIIKAYLNSTPNVYKKIFRSKLNRKKENA
jgi:uncharacterized protein YfbU (UPF0304 family)